MVLVPLSFLALVLSFATLENASAIVLNVWNQSNVRVPPRDDVGVRDVR